MERNTLMSSFEGDADDETRAASERTVMFVVTLIVTTGIVAFAVYVLGSAVLEARAGGSGHHAAIVAMPAES
jgi:hypothetical protein